MIKSASKRNKRFIDDNRLFLSEGDIIEIPFDDEFFDKIYTVNTVYFWQDIDKGLSEIKRVLKPGGTFINVVYSKEWLDKSPLTQYGFSKYTLDEVSNASVRNGFRTSDIQEIKKDKSYCLVLKK